MMTDLVTRAVRLAGQRQREILERVAGELRRTFGDAAVEVDEARVLVRGRGLIKRWLTDANIRFLQRVAR